LSGFQRFHCDTLWYELQGVLLGVHSSS
jgi:hypothetical protein